MSRQIRISVTDDEVFERLKRRKDALDLSWEDALRRGLRDSQEPPLGQRTPGSPRSRPNPSTNPHSQASSSNHPHSRSGFSDHGSHSDSEHPREREQQERGTGSNKRRRHRDEQHASTTPSPFDPDFGERIARQVLSSVSDSVPGFVGESLDEEIDRLEDAENAELVLGEDESERVPLRVSLFTGADGLDVEVVAVRSGKGTDEMNHFADGARSRVASRFAQGKTATLELDAGGEAYDVHPDLTWSRGPDGSPTVTDVIVREVVFEEG